MTKLVSFINHGKNRYRPVVLIKITIIQYTIDITSIHRTIREIKDNIAYRWYLGYELDEEIPYFSTFSKNYTRRFKDTNPFEKIFAMVINEITQNKKPTKIVKRHVWERYSQLQLK